jgi:hypothetical protein
VLQLLLTYSAAATIWCGIIYICTPALLAAFQLPHQASTASLITWFQAAAAIAMVQAHLNQLLASERMSTHILLAACAWLLVTILFPKTVGNATQSASHALVAAYVASLAYSTAAWRLSRPRTNTKP